MHDPTMYASGVFTGVILCLMLPAILWVSLLVADCNPGLVIGRAIRKFGDHMEHAGFIIEHDRRTANGPAVAETTSTKADNDEGMFDTVTAMALKA
jgi:hypothetical protein